MFIIVERRLREIVREIYYIYEFMDFNLKMEGQEAMAFTQFFHRCVIYSNCRALVPKGGTSMASVFYTSVLEPTVP